MAVAASEEPALATAGVAVAAAVVSVEPGWALATPAVVAVSSL